MGLSLKKLYNMVYDLFLTQKEVVNRFATEMQVSMLHIKSNIKTKKEVMANLDQWLTTIDGIKDALKDE
jgi:hypothetical protein